MFLILHASYTYQLMLQLFHNCFLMFSVLCLCLSLYLLLYVIHVYYSLCVCVVMWWQFSYCVVLWQVLDFLKHIHECTYVYVRQYWNISPLPLYRMLLSLFSSRTRAFTSPDNSHQSSSLLRRIFSIHSRRLVQYYKAVALNLSQERRKMLQTEWHRISI